MTAIAKSASGISLGTLLVPPTHKHSFGDKMGDRTAGAGETLYQADACYLGSDGRIYRALESQTGTTAAVNDVQTMGLIDNMAPETVTGTFVLGYKGQYTAPFLIGTDNAGTIQTALQGLSTVGAGNITVGAAFPNYTFTGAGAFAGTELDLIEVDSTALSSSTQIEPVLTITHTTVGEPAGASGAEQAQSFVIGYAMMKYKAGQPVTLMDCVRVPYSDGNLTPGAKVYLSSTVPGGLDTAPTLTGQRPLGYCVDTQQIYFYAVR